jgi:hypothetical protein
MDGARFRGSLVERSAHLPGGRRVLSLYWFSGKRNSSVSGMMTTGRGQGSPLLAL